MTQMPDWTSFLSAMTLALVRVSGMVAFAPFFSSTALPLRTKAVFVGAVAFLLIDMVTAAITTSIGMFQLPPVVVSTPLKILLFVMVDGWNLLANSLLKSF